jgi:hypothetical protein
MPPHESQYSSGFDLLHATAGSKNFVWDPVYTPGKGFEVSISEIQRSEGYSGVAKDIMSLTGLTSDRSPKKEVLRVRVAADSK